MEERGTKRRKLDDGGARRSDRTADDDDEWLLDGGQDDDTSQSDDNPSGLSKETRSLMEKLGLGGLKANEGENEEEGDNEVKVCQLTGISDGLRLPCYHSLLTIHRYITHREHIRN